MRIILKFILNSIRERKLRTAVMLLSIVLSTTLLFVSLSIGDSYRSAQMKMAKGLAGNATVSASASPDDKGNMVWITEDDIPKINAIQHMAGLLQTSALYRNDGHFENIDLIAADLDRFSAINKPRLQGNVELNNFTGYKIVLPDRLTSKFKLNPGDTVALMVGEKQYEFRLAAVAAYDTVFLRESRGTTALIPKETLAEILNLPNGYSKILIEPTKEAGTAKLITELKEYLPSGKYKIARLYDEKQIAAGAQQKQMPFFLIGFFALTMSVFIIFSSYKVIIMERLPIVGTFRSIGATEKEVTKILMLESLIYGVLGGIIGIPAGFAVLQLILNGLGESMSLGIEIPMVVSPLNIILSCIVAIFVSILSAFIPVRRASRLAVKDVVLGNFEEKNNFGIKKMVFGAGLFITSVILPRLTYKDNTLLTLACGFSLLGLIIATVITIPLFVNCFSCVFEKIYGVILGNEGRLAARNMKQNKNINQNITLLFISLSAVIAISVVGSFVATYIGDVFKGAALNGFTDANISNEFVEKVKSIHSMKDVLPIREIDGDISVDGKEFKWIEGVGNINQLCSMLNVRFENEETQKNIAAAFNSGRNILISNDCLKQRTWNVGDTISLDYNGKAYEYKIIGCFKSRADNSEAIVPAEYAESDFGSVNYKRLAYTAADPDAAIAQIRNLFGNQYNWSRTVKEFKKDALGTINSFLDPMNKLTYFILLLAAIGIINNLLINYIQKKRSIAMYKSVGMSNLQNIKMTILEGFTSGFIGAVIGLSVSYLEVETIFIATAPRVLVEPEWNIGIFLIAGAAAIIINLIGSTIPILKGSTMKLVEEIKFE